MPPSQNLRIRQVHTLGSPPPTLPCPYCPRHFHSKGGRTKHIRTKHDFQGLEPHEPSPSDSSPPPSQQPSSNESYHERVQSPIPSEAPREGSNAGYDMDVDHPIPDSDYTPPGSYVEELNRNSPPRGHAHNQHVPDPPRVTRAYHPKLDGKSLNIISSIYIPTLAAYCRADL
jgi:hypothetical protein